MQVPISMMSHKNLVPDEIVVEILARLPVKSLVRFRCVSKSWHRIINDPYFIQKVLNTSRCRAKNDRHGYLLVQQSPIYSARHVASPGFFSFVCDETFVEHIKLEIPFECVDLLGYSNGLLCFSYPIKTTMRNRTPEISTLYLWNPAIRSSKTLPRSLVQLNEDCICCFSYVPRTADYKVLKMSDPFTDQPPEAELYSLSTNSWKIIQDIPCRSYSGSDKNVVNDGVVHWIDWVASDNGSIITFDMGNETFREMKLPDLAFDDPFNTCLLLLLDGCVCLCVERGSWDDHCVELWVMKEYGVPESWTKDFTFNDFSFNPSPIGFLKNGEIVLEFLGRLVSYDPTSQQLDNLPIVLEQVETKTRRALLVTSYMETLVLL